MTGPAVSRVSDSFLVPIMPMNSTGMCSLPLRRCKTGHTDRTSGLTGRGLRWRGWSGALDFERGTRPRGGPWCSGSRGPAGRGCRAAWRTRTRCGRCRVPAGSGRRRSRNRRHWPGWPMRKLSPSSARASNHSLDLVRDRRRRRRRTGSGVGDGDELHRLPERVARCPAASRGDLLRAGAEPALGVHQRLLRERRVQVVLAEVVPGERAAELGQRPVEVPVGELQVTLDLAGLGVGVADVDRDAGHDHDLVRVRGPWRPRGP